MARTATVSKTKVAYQRLRELIEGGELDVGERLTEAKATRLLDMTRGPVREAILKLESEGLLVHKGTRRSRVVKYVESESEAVLRGTRVFGEYGLFPVEFVGFGSGRLRWRAGAIGAVVDVVFGDDLVIFAKSSEANDGCFKGVGS